MRDLISVCMYIYIYKFAESDLLTNEQHIKGFVFYLIAFILFFYCCLGGRREMDSSFTFPTINLFPSAVMWAHTSGPGDSSLSLSTWEVTKPPWTVAATLQRVTVRNWRPRRSVDPEGLPLLLPDAIFIESLYRADSHFWNTEVRKTNLFKVKAFLLECVVW